MTHRQWYFQDADGEYRWHDYPQGVKIAKGKVVKFPIYNDALGIHPKQKAQFEARNALHGTDVKYTNDGRAIIESHDQLKRQMKLDGRIDRKAFYD